MRKSASNEAPRIDAAAASVTAPVTIRVNPDVDPETHTYITTGKRENKFGIDLETAARLAREMLDMVGVRMVGVHVHIGSQITRVGPYTAALEKALEFAGLCREMGHPVDFINLGGGFGIDFATGRVEQDPDCDWRSPGFPGHVQGDNHPVILASWQDAEAFCRWLAGIKEYFDMPVGTYSSGMRSRFTFSLMLALDFDIYLIDEGMPQTTDAEFNRKAGAILRERLENTTVIIVSHQAQTLERFARSAAVLRNGQLHMFDSLEEAKQMYDYQA